MADARNRKRSGGEARPQTFGLTRPWRAVDNEGEVLESYVTKTLDRAAAAPFIKNAMKHHGRPQAVSPTGSDLVAPPSRRSATPTARRLAAGSIIRPRTHTSRSGEERARWSGFGE